MTGFGKLVYDFYTSLAPTALPRGFSWLEPQRSPEVQQLMAAFYSRYFSDKQPRTLALGINPGRHGAGITGINFTAPLQLTQPCGIHHNLGDGNELSAIFIYEVIESFGGPAAFYSQFFIGSVCPLGLVYAGKNINYYDDARVQQRLMPFIISCINAQYQWPVNRHTCICIGGEKNYRFLSSLNEKQEWFREIIPLPHPRFIMQYRRREKQSFLDQYRQAFTAAQKAS